MRGDAGFFDAIARLYDRAYALSGSESKGRLARLLGELPERSRVLDLGVGTGRELSMLLDAGHAPVGVDFSANMLATCNLRARPIPLVQADFWEPLPFEDRSFDAVIALHGALAHPPRDEAVGALLTEVARVLAAGGVFVAEVPTPAFAGGAGTFVHEDRATHARILARLYPPDFWQGALSVHFDARVEALGEAELFIVGRLSACSREATSGPG